MRKKQRQNRPEGQIPVTMRHAVASPEDAYGELSEPDTWDDEETEEEGVPITLETLKALFKALLS